MFNSFLRRFTVYIIVALVAVSCNNQSNTNTPITIPGLIYTKHARCRMECRHITEREIREVITENTINQRKSDPNGRPCPTTAYEGYTTENQHLRIIIGKCDNKWKVVTCIDLENEFDCDCH
ncbi:MAG TPA: DUF4258 domain-containing protein [Chitinophagales bacterium]|nr:DUF4258 domain-containing protein [Chitinophagales bacterium]